MYRCFSSYGPSASQKTATHHVSRMYMQSSNCDGTKPCTQYRQCSTKLRLYR